MSCLYQILGVHPSASTNEIKIIIKSKYKRLALKYHPDRNTASPKMAEIKFKEITKAHEILKDPLKRKEYDFQRMGLNQFHSISPNGPSYFFSSHNAIDVFSEIFNSQDEEFFDLFSFDTKPKKNRHRKSSDRFCSPKSSPPVTYSIERDLYLTLEEMQMGTCQKFEADYEIINNCALNDFNIYYELDIPSGSLPNEIFDVQVGDVIIHFTIKAKKHPYYDLLSNTNDLTLQYDISVIDALCGCSIKIKAFDGNEEIITLSDVITPNYRLVLHKKGLYSSKNDSFSNLIVIFKIFYPDSLTPSQKLNIRKAFTEQM